MANVSLVLLIGIPGAGKTHFCNKVMHIKTNKCDEDDTLSSFENLNIIHVCYDSIIPLDKQKEFRELARSESYESSWKAEREKISNNIENLVRVLTESQNISEIQTTLENYGFTGNLDEKNCKYIIMLDDNFYYRSMRHQFYSIAYKHKIGFCQIFFNCSLEKAIEKNSKRKSSHQIPSEAISEMFNKLQKPSSDFHWEANSIEIDSDVEQSLKLFITLVNKSLMSPADSVEKELDRREKILSSDASRVVCSKSVVHQSDLLLRQFVGSILSSSGSVLSSSGSVLSSSGSILSSSGSILSSSLCGKALAAKNANESRQFLLDGLKKGDIKLVSEDSEEFKHLLKEQLYKLFIDKYEELSAL